MAPYNHQSLQAEHEIKSLSTSLTKCLTCLGQTWSKYLPLAIFAYNTFNTPNLANFSPYELVLCRFLILLYHYIVGRFSGTEHWLLKASFHPANSWTSSHLREN